MQLVRLVAEELLLTAGGKNLQVPTQQVIPLMSSSPQADGVLISRSEDEARHTFMSVCVFVCVCFTS